MTPLDRARAVVRAWTHETNRAEKEQTIARAISDAVGEAAAWKDAVIDAAVVNWSLAAGHENDPRAAVRALCDQIARVALDPAVSREAKELHDRIAAAERRAEVGWREVERLTSPLGDNELAQLRTQLWAASEFGMQMHAEKITAEQERDEVLRDLQTIANAVHFLRQEGDTVPLAVARAVVEPKRLRERLAAVEAARDAAVDMHWKALDRADRVTNERDAAEKAREAAVRERDREWGYVVGTLGYFATSDDARRAVVELQGHHEEHHEKLAAAEAARDQQERFKWAANERADAAVANANEQYRLLEEQVQQTLAAEARLAAARQLVGERKGAINGATRHCADELARALADGDAGGAGAR